MKHFLVALQFLTIFPVRIKGEIKEDDFGKALAYFPLAGLVIGVVLVFTLFICDFLPSLVKAAFLLIVSIIITAGLHLDGFADTCDGFYGVRSKEEILKIMKDSHTGVMAVIGLVCLLLVKFSVIAGIPSDILGKILIVMAVFSRWSQVVACFSSEYVRDQGKAKCFVEYAGKKEMVVSTVMAVALIFLIMQIKGIILFFISILPVLLFINYVQRKIGGMTGDTVGAVNEIAEASVFLISIMLYGKI